MKHLSLQITTLGQALQSNLQLDSLLSAVLNAMTEGLVLIDHNGRIALANPRIELFGLSPEQLVNQQVETLLSDPKLHLAARLGFESEQQLQTLLQTFSAPDQPVSYSFNGPG